jgi:hypothetical protein
MKTRRFVLALILGLVISCGGKKDGDGGGGDDNVKWPAQPEGGAPLAFESLEVVKDKAGKDLVAKVRIFNFSDKGVKGFNGKLHYLDASDKELKSFPWGHSAGLGLVKAKGTAVEEMGAFIPEGTKKVTVELRNVTFDDGSKWERAK